ncbi:Hypothetical protein FKW44_012340, partial [Caligus rogercresseyi]
DIRSSTSSSCLESCTYCKPPNFSYFFTGTGLQRGVMTFVSKALGEAQLIKEHSSKSEWHLVRVTSGDSQIN